MVEFLLSVGASTEVGILPLPEERGRKGWPIVFAGHTSYPLMGPVSPSSSSLPSPLPLPSLSLSLPPLIGGGLSWQCSAGEGGTSHGRNQRPSCLPGEEREGRGE